MVRTPRRLPYGRHLIEDDDIAAVRDVLRSNWLTGGPAVARFEAALATATGAPHAVVCSSGTAALHLAALALDLGPDDWVVVPTLTFLATANAARYVGAEVWFADVDPETGLLTPDKLREALSTSTRRGKRVRAVFPVHLNGQVAHPDSLWEIATENSVPLVADGCHAIGTRYDTPQGEARVGDGRHTIMTAFSFHPVKTVAMGEGGAITTDNAALAERVRSLRNHGMTREVHALTEREQALSPSGDVNPWYYEIQEPGFNYRASDIHCALGTSQLCKLERFVTERHNLAARYDQLLSSLAPNIRPIARIPGCRPAWHLYVVLIDFEVVGITRGALMQRLADERIFTQVHYLPVNRQPYYRRRYGELSFPGANRYYSRCLSLPLFAGMTDADVDRVVDALKRLTRQ